MSLQDSLAQAASYHRIEGAVAAVTHGGRRRAAATGAYASPDALVRTASVQKPMVAMAALLAVGTDGLDAPVVDDLPELADRWRIDRGITLRHLLSHTAGVHSDLTKEAAFGLGVGDDALAAAVAHVAERGQRFPLGAAWEYCNAGFYLAAHVLATRAGTSFEQFLADMLFTPLGMASTTFEHETESYPRARRAAGGLWSTGRDVLTFAEFALTDPRGRAALDVMSEPVAETYLGTPYGLGLQVGGSVLWQSGSFAPFGTRLTLVPEQGYAAFVAARGVKRDPVVEEVMRDELRDLGVSGPAAAQRAAVSVRAWVRLRRSLLKE
ncbi:CubicO group peptidase (beta-lactamase class C family) [Allocatelliglobosispora scoriae]|uniref:CubicO group peptidase (Beta-lactamase class C family) n=1 Tax=Allocatelliglobosispora scoriae TaxID=643052 RepID=A0A841C0X4_9ACTN|nr:serine hydrolase domain-containing protein [Allocatelliglobosispora scoriae]MBB5872531.1 CubicO group peptidase (beta-lactamase class C family) [Allocatelliglobosispora scoriae]